MIDSVKTICSRLGMENLDHGVSFHQYLCHCW